MSAPIRLPNAAEQDVLNEIIVRPVTDDERPRWDELVAANHYLKNATLVGEHLAYVVIYRGIWLALLGWSAPARHLRPRDRWIGWSNDQLRQRRHFLANNARFCVLVDRQQLPNLASRALALCCARLSEDWQARWGHPILAVESFVDGQIFRGTAYKAAGWTRLDDTSGFARVSEDFYERHDRPKQLWVRELDRKARSFLSAKSLPPTLAPLERALPEPRARCHIPTQRCASLMEQLPKVPDPRDAKGRWHPWSAILGIVVLAKLCGVRMGQRQVATFARELSQPQRRSLNCRRDPGRPGKYVVPSESTYQRAIIAVNLDIFEPLLLRWQDEQIGPTNDALIAIDGKHQRRSGGHAIVGAVGQPSQRVYATEAMGSHDSEITKVQDLLAKTEFTGKIVSLDALHTQHETVHQILYDHGGDYILPLKDNQPTLHATAKTLLPEDFFP